MVHVDGPLAAIGNILADDSGFAVLVLLPLAAVGAGIFVPIGAAQDVWIAVAVHVERGDAFSVVGAQTVHEECDLRDAAGAGTGSGFALGCGGIGCLGRSEDGACESCQQERT